MYQVNPNPWWGGKGEPELRSLYEWLDTYSHYRGNDRRGAILGASLGTFWGLVGGAIGVLAGGFEINPAISVTIPAIAGMLFTAAMVIWYVRGRTDMEKAMTRSAAEMRGFLWKLIGARWQGNVKGLIGEECAKVLNSAAFEYLQCKTALNSPAWQAVNSDSPWAQARDKTKMAMDVAMSRIVTAIGQGASPSDPAVESLISDMQRTTAEAAATASRLATHAGLPGDATNELRKALSEMRALNEADEEFSDLTRGV